MQLLKLFLSLSSVVLLTACSSAGEISILNNNVNLNTIPMSKGEVNAYFTIKNTGSEAVELQTGQTSCMCTKATIKIGDTTSAVFSLHEKIFLQQTLEPNQEAVVTATFDPNAHGPDATGPVSRDIMITTNSQSTPLVRLSFFGNVVK